MVEVEIQDLWQRYCKLDTTVQRADRIRIATSMNLETGNPLVYPSNADPAHQEREWGGFTLPLTELRREAPSVDLTSH